LMQSLFLTLHIVFTIGDRVIEMGFSTGIAAHDFAILTKINLRLSSHRTNGITYLLIHK